MSASRETLKKNTELAITAPEGAVVPKHVWLPPALRDKQIRVIQDVAVTTAPPSISDNVIRISAEADPIGMLIAVANGQPIASYEVTESGEVVQKYETLTLIQRLQVMKYLADKVIPKMSMVHTVMEDKRKDPDPHSWDATVKKAAGKADD